MPHTLRRFFFLLAAVLAWTASLLAPSPSADAKDGQPSVLVFTVSGEINRVTDAYVGRALGQAQQNGDALVVMRVDTPGGELEATRSIVQRLLASPVPVAAYVSPSGARAGSAGTFLVAAANFAVMAPATNLGAATPISGSGEDLPPTLKSKVTNDAAALIRSIAQERGRNQDKLEQTVVGAASYSSSEAVEEQIVDLVATDIDDLLGQLQGRSTKTPSGVLTLDLTSAVQRPFAMSLRERFTDTLANPNLVAILLTIGIIAIFIELLNPGIGAAAIVGAAALVLAFLGLGTLPFQWAGLLLIGIGAVLIAVEMFTGSGLLGVAAAVAFVLGVFLLFVGTPTLPGAPPLAVSLWVLGIIGLSISAFTVLMVTALIKTRRLHQPSEVATLLGKTGTVTTDLAPLGTVQMAGELWTARCEEPEHVARAGDVVKVTGVEGLTLKVRVEARSSIPS